MQDPDKKEIPPDVLKKILDKEPVGKNSEGTPPGGVPPNEDERNSGKSGGQKTQDDGDDKESV